MVASTPPVIERTNLSRFAFGVSRILLVVVVLVIKNEDQEEDDFIAA